MNNVFPPKENTIEYPNPRIFLPYTNLQPATLISLIGYDYRPVKLEGEYDYSNYFKQRWEEKEKFISIEHDMVIWPGAIEAIWDCPNPICAYGLSLPIHRKEVFSDNPRVIRPGVIKFEKEVFSVNPKLWDEPVTWSMVDQHLSKCGVKVHQHFPGVVNANLDLLGFVNYKEEHGSN